MEAAEFRERLLDELRLTAEPDRVYRTTEPWAIGPYDPENPASRGDPNLCGALPFAESLAIALGIYVQDRDTVIAIYDPTVSLPSNPELFDSYIASADGNGWTTGHIYEWTGASWVDITPRNGMLRWIEAEESFYFFINGTWYPLDQTLVAHGLNDHTDVDFGCQPNGSFLRCYHPSGGAAVWYDWNPAGGGLVDGFNADMLDGKHAVEFAALSHNHSAANITSGTLSVARGGTGAGTLTGYLKGNGTSAFSAVASIPWEDLSGVPSEFTPASHTLLSHTVSGLTPGYFLKALSATTFGFTAHGLTYTDVGALSGTDPRIVNWNEAYSWGDHAGLYAAASHNHSAGHITSGTLSVTRGGTGASTLTGYLKGNGTSAFSAVAAVPWADLSGIPSSFTPASHALLTHTASGLTTGHFLKALSATTFGFATHGLSYSDVGAAAASHNHSAGHITSGTLSVTRGGTGAGTLTGYVKGNGTAAFTASTSIPWADLSGVPDTFTPAAHLHAIADVTSLQTILDGKVSTSDPRLSDARTPINNDYYVQGSSSTRTTDAGDTDVDSYTQSGFYRPLNAAPNLPTVAAYGIIHTNYTSNQHAFQLASRWYGNQLFYRTKSDGTWRPWVELWHTGNFDPNDYALVGHTHDALYAGLSHNHSAAHITSGTLSVSRGGTGASTLTGYLKGNGTSAFTASTSIPWADLSGVPGAFTPSAHTHLWADITDKPSTFTPAAHLHAIADVTSLQTILDGKVSTSDPRLSDARTPINNDYYVQGSSSTRTTDAGDTDVDSYTQSGFYRPLNAAPNLPTVAAYGIIHTNYTSNQHAFQLASRWYGNQLFYRTKSDGTWRPWVELWHTGNFDPNDYALVGHTHDALYAAASHNHDAAYLKLTGGTISGALHCNQLLKVGVNGYIHLDANQRASYATSSADSYIYTFAKDLVLQGPSNGTNAGVKIVTGISPVEKLSIDISTMSVNCQVIENHYYATDNLSVTSDYTLTPTRPVYRVTTVTANKKLILNVPSPLPYQYKQNLNVTIINASVDNDLTVRFGGVVGTGLVKIPPLAFGMFKFDTAVGWVYHKIN